MAVRNGKKSEKRANSNGEAEFAVSSLAQLQSDLAGLERLHALQSSLIREIRRQLEAIEANASKENSVSLNVTE